METIPFTHTNALHGPFGAALDLRIQRMLPPSEASSNGVVAKENPAVVNYKIAGNYLTEADAVTALDYLQAKGYPHEYIGIIDPGHPTQGQIHGVESNGKKDKENKKPAVRATIAVGIFVVASALTGQLEGTLWGSTALTLGIMGFTTLMGGASMLFHDKPIKELQFEKVISRYAKKHYWTVLVYADREKLARFALRLIEHTSCRNALVCGPAPIK